MSLSNVAQIDVKINYNHNYKDTDVSKAHLSTSCTS